MLSVAVATDEIVRSAGAIAYDGTGRPSKPLPLGQVDYLSEIELELEGTMTCVGVSANTLFSKGPLGLISALYLNINGKVFPLSADAFGFKVLRLVNRPGSRTPEIAPVATAAAPGTVNNWSATLRMPLSVALGRNDLRGLVWTGNLQTSVTLTVVWNTEAGAINLGAANTATFDGQLNVNIVSLAAAPPAPASDQTAAQGLYGPASWLHTFTLTSTPVVNTGDVNIPLDIGNKILRLIFAVRNGGDYTTDIVSSISLKIQNLVQPRFRDATWLREALCDDYQLPYDAATGLPYVPAAQGTPELTGLYVVDFFRTFTDRDVLETDGLTELKAIVNVAAGTALNDAQIDMYQEQLVELGAPITKI